MDVPPLPDSPAPSSLHNPPSASSSPSTPSKPPMAARLSLTIVRSARPRAGTTAASYLDSLARALPSSSVDSSVPTYADLVRPPDAARLKRSLSQSSKRSVGKSRAPSWSSGGSSGMRRSSASSASGSRTRRTTSIGSAHSADASASSASDQSGNLADLTWGTKWWPFAVVAPEDVKGKGKAMDQSAAVDEASDGGDTAVKAQSRTFLELFAGRGPVEAAKEQQAAVAMTDDAEAELLSADLDTLRLATTEEPPPLPKKSDKPSTPSSPTTSRPTSYLPTSIFSSKPLEGPTSLFSNFSISNPFTPTASPPSGRQQHVRRYSTGSSENGDRKKPANKYMDEEDQDNSETGEQADYMDAFSLLKEKYECPKLPVVFCHGLFGFDTIGPKGFKPLQFSYWIGVKDALEAIGVEVLIGRVPASASIEERAKVLCEQIEQTFPGREVSLIGHSMGGLDARYLVSRLKPTTFKVRSITTIATPHRGSSMSDYLLDDLLGASHVPTLQGFLKTVGIPGGGAAFNDLTTSKMERFNAETPDDPSVRYFSYGAEFEPGWSNVFRVSWGVIHEREGANDGLVSVESSKWGEYKATLTNVNHLDLVGWVGKVRYTWAELLGQPIKFKPVSFYLALVESLAQEGF